MKALSFHYISLQERLLQETMSQGVLRKGPALLLRTLNFYSNFVS